MKKWSNTAQPFREVEIYFMVGNLDIKIKKKIPPGYMITYVHKCFTLHIGALGTNTSMDTLISFNFFNFSNVK